LLHVEPPHKYRQEIERKKSRTHTSDIHILENFKEYITLLAPEFTDLCFVKPKTLVGGADKKLDFL
jgi:hypothetical protein